MYIFHTLEMCCQTGPLGDCIILHFCQLALCGGADFHGALPGRAALITLCVNDLFTCLSHSPDHKLLGARSCILLVMIPRVSCRA